LAIILATVVLRNLASGITSLFSARARLGI
jgi:hypothetical protein